MRDGHIIALVVSFALHFMLAVAGLVRFPPPPKPPAQEMVVLPLEIMKISDSTNVAAMTTAIPKTPDAKALEEKTKEASASDAAPATPAEAEIMPGDKPTPKPTPTASPKKEAGKEAQQKKESFDDALNSVLQSAKSAKPAPRTAQNPGNIANVGDRNQRGMGDNKSNTATFAAYFSSQLRQRCWGDQDDLPDARRLRATFRVRFQPSGQLNGQPEYVDPKGIPAADQPMKVFMTRALRALQQCQPYTIPPEYNQKGQPPIDLEFTP